ncbi:Qat anti-phage system QueC-like protein QatC [Achromobacter agilis]|uniref:7-cyano-7-deazaguanine synthase n=1 Tax=Achromobacter agilis TaxID=1353888 RepID=A0A446CDA5_9BURK|nr:Qat anti-phage system QueC-like protein QatC [Achromobacter agilis]SSW65850.1 7-cyano-7-deazaguanine synthase [Achromobacter agilis]
MTKVLCTSVSHLPATLADGERAFTLFKSAKRAGVGTIAQGWRGSLKRKGFAPSAQAWDFVQFCLSVCAADLCCLRNTSADGWTRTIELTVGLHEPLRWAPWKAHVEQMLKVLTGDYWTLHFVEGGVAPPNGRLQPLAHDCISLLSGGLDSLVGGIDLVTSGRQPAFVSQLAHEDSERQRRYATLLGGGATHMQWSHGINFTGRREPSTRGRSLAFYGFAVMAASKIAGQPVQVFVPENGFICVNPPLVPGRVSSLSTRTTHPLFMAMLQELLEVLDIDVRLELPYRFKTKGEMLRECANQTLLDTVASDSTSCGRYRTYNRTHCGRCVPCMIRRAAFLAWGHGRDRTTYTFPSLAGSDKSSGPDDPMAAALAVLSVREQGLDRFLGATLAFAAPGERGSYRGVLQAGLGELEALLQADGLL